MELISTQWIPLFTYFFLKYTTKPTIYSAIGSAVSLFLNLISTPYYFIFSLMVGVLILAGKFKQNYHILFSKKSFILNVVLSLLIILPASYYVFPVFSLIQDEVSLSYSPRDFSMDLLAPFIFGGHSRFASFTRWYWEKLPGNIHESSVYIGFVPLFIVMYVVKTKILNKKSLHIWYITLIIFFTLSLGPVLHVLGREVGSIIMPYTFFEFIGQSLSIGTPIRFMIIVILCISIICAYGFAYLFKSTASHRLIAYIFIIVLFIEYLPRNITLSDMSIPGYVQFIKNLPDKNGLIDLVAPYPSLSMFYQTFHEKPIQFGYISRIPLRTITANMPIFGYIQNYDYRVLREKYKFRYWANSKPLPQKNLCPQLIYQDNSAYVYDLAYLSSTCS